MPKNITLSKWSAYGLPTGLAINTATGVISGTPNVQPPASYSVNVSVTTNYGNDSEDITINVAVPDDWKPVITSGQVINVIAGEVMTPYSVAGTNVRP